MSHGKEIQAVDPNGKKVVLDLKHSDALDITNLNSEQQAAIQLMRAEKMLELQAKAVDMKVSLQALDATLTSLITHAEQATQSQTAVTVEHSQTTSIGKTEVIIGNTSKAAGAKDNTLLIVSIIAVAIIIAALILK